MAGAVGFEPTSPVLETGSLGQLSLRPYFSINPTQSSAFLLDPAFDL